MSRKPSELRKKAKQIWLRSGRKKKPKQIADQLGISAELVRKWKSIDQWEATPIRGRGAPEGNQNALGNKGGRGGPEGNDHAVKHGLFRKFLPDDPETLEIFDQSEHLNRMDMLWLAIRTKWTNIVRAQKIMFVQDKDDETKTLKKNKQQLELVKRTNAEGVEEEVPVPVYIEEEYDIQYAWDKQGRALTAQASAMRELRALIRQYEDMLRQADPSEVNEKRQAEMDLLKSRVKAMQEEAW
ncbi:hypothetical protein J41TS12_17540 [Paenibacillus antibioticophila]|uniref:PBSX phage terminase small subunit-like N-terminal domain-containing protein n=1 Tax=Paenibacillus antibioticophila TaxID=1274374 RepID=A0A919XSS0_9BACL|nr:phage terminase small subunit [Paenibacillus antibioticophila]GIO36893.1 hypothetical protein J41TS12_17540 [Paenibacillus antibioticophila]